jgi:hypothetical protein
VPEEQAERAIAEWWSAIGRVDDGEVPTEKAKELRTERVES